MQLAEGGRDITPLTGSGPAPPIQTAVADTGSLGLTGLPQVPGNNQLILVGTCESSSSALSWISTNPTGSSPDFPSCGLPGPGGIHQLTACSCHRAAGGGTGKPAPRGCPQGSGVVGRGEHFPDAQRSGGIEMKTQGQLWGAMEAWRWLG